jgi:nicotinate phosphoribosyltransferase
MKVSENPEKVTLPGVKKVWRTLDSDGFFAGDAIGLANQGEPERFHHPVFPVKNTPLHGLRVMELLVDVMHSGEPLVEERDLGSIAAYSRSRLDCLPPEVLRFENPHEYKVGISPELMGLRDRLLEERLSG